MPVLEVDWGEVRMKVCMCAGVSLYPCCFDHAEMPRLVLVFETLLLLLMLLLVPLGRWE